MAFESSLASEVPQTSCQALITLDSWDRGTIVRHKQKEKDLQKLEYELDLNRDLVIKSLDDHKIMQLYSIAVSAVSKPSYVYKLVDFVPSTSPRMRENLEILSL